MKGKLINNWKLLADLCMKDLLIVVSIVIIRLKEKVTFSNMCNHCMKELFMVVIIVTIRPNGKATF